MTLEQALAYLTPHPHTNGPVQLTPAKMREAIGVIRAALPPPAPEPFDKGERFTEVVARLMDLPGVYAYRLGPAFKGQGPLNICEHLRCKAWVDDIEEPFVGAVSKDPVDCVESVIRKIEKSRAA